MGPNVSVQPLAQRKRNKTPPLQMLEVSLRANRTHQSMMCPPSDCFA